MSKGSNSNMQFLIGNGVLAFGVFFVICLFLYLSFRTPRKAGEEDSYGEIYAIELNGNLAGEDISVYVNDSLLYNNVMDGVTRGFKVKRFADESVLMVVKNKTEDMTPMNLDMKGAKLEILKKDNKIVIETR